MNETKKTTPNLTILLMILELQKHNFQMTLKFYKKYIIMEFLNIPENINQVIVKLLLYDF